MADSAIKGLTFHTALNSETIDHLQLNFDLGRPDDRARSQVLMCERAHQPWTLHIAANLQGDITALSWYPRTEVVTSGKEGRGCDVDRKSCLGLQFGYQMSTLNSCTP